jgi:hypothetical protein
MATVEQDQKPNASPAANAKLERLRARLDDVLSHYGKQRLNTRDHSPWEVLHSVIGNGLQTQVLLGGPEGEPRSAIGWLCFNQNFRGERMLTLQNGRPIGVLGAGLQGHHGQTLAYLAQTNLQRDYPMWVAGRSFTLEDLIENEKLTCRGGTELTFKLISLAHYLPSDAAWKSDDGQDWSISRLIKEEIVQPIQGAACGGTHRLMGLSYAVFRREKDGKPLNGEFKRAYKYTTDYQRFTFRLQNPDGSFSTQWLEHSEARPDLNRRLQTSGHITEWLAFSLPEEDLLQPDMVRAVEYLSGILSENRARTWPIGPLGHSLHALSIYRRRAFPSVEEEKMALHTAPEPEAPSSARAANNQLAASPTTKSSSTVPPAAKPVLRSILRRPPAPMTRPRPAADAAARRGPRVSSGTGPLLVPAQPWLK